MTERKSLSPMQKLKVFEGQMGVCHICDQKIQSGQKWEVEHIIPLALGGEDRDWNMAPAHKACHAGKTKTDNASWTKAKRCAAKHTGAKRPSAFKSKWKRRVDGTTVLREQQS